MITNPLIKTDSVKPRIYQEVIAAEARDMNLLCVLPTGLGKSLVGILTAAHRLSQFPNTKILCLAPTKPLVNQLCNNFSKNLNFNAELFQVLTGSQSPQKRKETWKTAKFIFATPQTVESDLLRGYINIEEFALVIFDECLTGDSKILLANNTTKKIKEIVEDFQKGKDVYVKSYDLEKNKLLNKRIIRAQELPCLQRLVKIQTDSRQINATESHEFLVQRNSKLNWVKANELTINDELATSQYTAEEFKNNIIIDEKDIHNTYSEDQRKNIELYYKAIDLKRKYGLGGRRISKKLNHSERQINNWLYSNIIPRPIKLINDLNKIGLMPFSYNSPNISIIFKIIGHIFGDGWLCAQNKSKVVIGFSGKVEDLRDIQSDLEILGLKYSSIYSRKTHSGVNNRDIFGTTNSFTCTDRRLTRLLIALGIPSGKYVAQEILLPNWIMNAPKFLKREFLASLFGSDAYTPKSRKNSRSFYAIRFSFNKYTNLKKNALKYANQIKSLLSEFDIEVSDIKMLPGNTLKNGNSTIKILITLASSNKNLINFFNNISYNYCHKKSEKACQFYNYICKKQGVKELRERICDEILKLNKRGYTNHLISNKLNIPLYVVEQRIYNKRKMALPLKFPTFDNYSESKEQIVNIKLENIMSINIIKSELVYDLTVEDTHNFIANNFVVHNCHRAVGDYAYTWIAEQFNKHNIRILALTASPASEKEKLDEVRRNLFISKVEVRSESDPDVKPYIKEKKIEKVFVNLPKEFENVKSNLESALKQRLIKLKELGVINSSDINKARKVELLKLQGVMIRQGEAESYMAVSILASCIKLMHSIELIETQGISPFLKFIEDLGKQKSKASKNLLSDWSVKKAAALASLSSINEHPKLTELKRIVKENAGEKMIIFTQYRNGVENIIDSLKDIEGVSPIAFIGQKEGMTQKKQLEAVQGFREGTYNILVATSVSEEGIDIPSVPIAIFYESVPSALRSIQRRGRVGRTDVGTVYLLITKDTIDEKYYWVARHKEKRMGELLKDLKNKDNTQSKLDAFNS